METAEHVTDPAGAQVRLGPIGQKVVFENDEVRVWEVVLEPGDQQPWHRHDNPYLVVGIEAADNRIDLFGGGEPRRVREEVGGIVCRSPGEVHMLTNDGSTRYCSRIIELKHLGEAQHRTQAVTQSRSSSTDDMEQRVVTATGSATYSGLVLARLQQQVDALAGQTLPPFREVLVNPTDVEWAEKTLEGLSSKMLWRNDETGASIALVRFAKDSGIPERHSHASNQFMFCLSGRYTYLPAGLTLIPGSFYWNPKGCEHGPTRAEEESILLEVYDGPHYATQPAWYSRAADAY